MAEDEEAVTADPHTILVVDDEPDLEALVRQRMRREIRRGVYQFEFAGNGEEALEVLKSNDAIDIVLTDINMPRMDGLELLSRVGKLDQELRSVVVSAYGDMKNIRQAMNLGAFDFVVKPVDFNDLRVTIDRTIKNLMSWREAMDARNRLVSIENELGVAKSMQQSILPTSFVSAENHRLYANMVAAREVGGDFYDFYVLPDGRIGLAIADVSGKGVPAALFMMVSRTLLKSAAAQGSDPADVIRTVNDILCADNDSMMFVTMIYAIYDPNTHMLSYCNGGHNPMMVVHRDGSSELSDPHDGVALGVASDYQYTSHQMELRVGDTLVFYTDGVNEAENRNEELFGMERFSDIFERGYSDARAASEAVFDGVHSFVGDHLQSDDITCLTLCVGPNN